MAVPVGQPTGPITDDVATIRAKLLDYYEQRTKRKGSMSLSTCIAKAFSPRGQGAARAAFKQLRELIRSGAVGSDLLFAARDGGTVYVIQGQAASSKQRSSRLDGLVSDGKRFCGGCSIWVNASGWGTHEASIRHQARALQALAARSGLLMANAGASGGAAGSPVVLTPLQLPDLTVGG